MRITLPNLFRRFLRDRSGASTVEFVLVFPAFIMIFLNGFEAGYFMVRDVMLERSVDVAIRQVRIGGSSAPDFENFKKLVCSGVAGVFPDCEKNLMVAMEEVPAGAGGVATLGDTVQCLDKETDITPAEQTSYDTGTANQLMVVRVCALAQPFFPTTRLGMEMGRDAEGNLAIVALSSFVNEPT